MKKTLAPVLALALIFSFALIVLANESAANSKEMSCTNKECGYRWRHGYRRKSRSEGNDVQCRPEDDDHHRR
jgi:hypothetical protein